MPFVIGDGRTDTRGEDLPEEMSLDQALHILCEANTRADRDGGFVCGPPPYFEDWQIYIKAWRRVRKHLGLPYEPEG